MLRVLVLIPHCYGRIPCTPYPWNSHLSSTHTSPEGLCCFLLQLLLLRIDGPCSQCIASSPPMPPHQPILILLGRREKSVRFTQEVTYFNFLYHPNCGLLEGHFWPSVGLFHRSVSLPTQSFSLCSPLWYMLP